MKTITIIQDPALRLHIHNGYFVITDDFVHIEIQPEEIDKLIDALKQTREEFDDDSLAHSDR
jgi:SepF-like predicted cell division protein (DUF552 family)